MPPTGVSVAYAWARYTSTTGTPVDSLAKGTTAASPLAEALHAFKYRGNRDLGRRLAVRFARQCSTIERRFDVIVPVPMAAPRLRDRGYNQSAWFARAISSARREPHACRALARRFNPSPQRSSSGAHRRRSQRGSFGGGGQAHRVRGRRVLLVDDVITTGATLSDAARALRTLGASDVCSVALLVAERPNRNRDAGR